MTSVAMKSQEDLKSLIERGRAIHKSLVNERPPFAPDSHSSSCEVGTSRADRRRWYADLSQRIQESRCRVEELESALANTSKQENNKIEKTNKT